MICLSIEIMHVVVTVNRILSDNAVALGRYECKWEHFQGVAY